MMGVLWDQLEDCAYHPPLDVDNTNFADLEGDFVASYGRLTKCFCLYLVAGSDGYYAVIFGVCSCRRTCASFITICEECRIRASNVLFGVS